MKLQHAKKIEKALQLQQKGKYREAEQLFTEVLQADPRDFAALFSLGFIALQDGAHAQALQYFEQAVLVRPDFAPAWYNRGVVLQAMKRTREAVASYDCALQRDRSYVDAWLNRGALLQELRLVPEALDNYHELLKLDPDNKNGLRNKAVLLTDLKRYDEALGCLERLLRVDPDFDYALGAHCYVKQLACQWDGLKAATGKVLSGIAAGKTVCEPRVLLTLTEAPAEHLAGARLFAQRQFPPRPPRWRGERYRHDKIRLAYVSPDLQQHPVSHLMAGVFEQHDRSRFETIAISLGMDDGSPVRKRLAASFDKFIDAHELSSEQIAETLRALEVDIAVDLAGYTRGARPDIFAQRPAPLQVNFLGYPATMGADYMDYILANDWLVPEADRAYFSEKVVYLPENYLPTDDTLRLAENVPGRAHYGLPEHGFVFCSFNHDYKITEELFDIWMRLLRRVPGSVLWLMKLNPFAEKNLQREAKLRGIDPDRLVFATRVPAIEDHLARYRLADLFLDTLPYNGHTTACDALLAGLPVVTCLGKSFQGRVAASLVYGLDLPELVVDSLPAYEELAFRLTADGPLLDEIRAKLAVQRATAPLFDTKRYCRNLEAAYYAMWERQQRGEAPIHLCVAPAAVPGAAALTDAPEVPEAAGEPHVLLQRALALQAQGDLRQAEGLFRRVLLKQPGSVAALYSLGAIALNAGDAKAALGHLDAALSHNDSVALLWTGRGIALQALGEATEALASYDRALALDPTAEEAKARRAQLSAALSGPGAAGAGPAYNICSLSPIFSDVAETLRYGLSQLGCRVSCVPAIVSQATNILLGSESYLNWDVVPSDAIIFNLEQLGSSSTHVTEGYLEQLGRHRVWDYSERNIAWLQQSGVNAGASLVRIGYAPTLERVAHGETQDIDVLFYGWINPRRRQILTQLEERGLKVVALERCFGAELDAYIARAKVVLNIHFYETKIFEIVRVSYLLTNAKAVVSEIGPDTEIEPALREAVCGAPYEELAEACVRLVHDDELRARQERRGYELFSARPQAAYLAQAVREHLDEGKGPAGPPRVSVVIPCYNQAQYLPEAVASVTAQSYPSFEIIIVNDGSPDDTSSVARELIASYPRQRITLLEKPNGGLASARNFGIARAQGEYVLTLDADDKIHPEMLRKTVELLDRTPEVSIAYTDYQHFGDAHHTVQTPEYDFKTLYSERCLHTATALFRKKAWTDTGGYNRNMIWGTEDWEFWINCGKHGHFGKRIPEVLFYYRAKLKQGSMLAEAKQQAGKLQARFVLNHQTLYDPERIAWARELWAQALVDMLQRGGEGDREFAYLSGLDPAAVVAEAEVLAATGRMDGAIDLYRFWLEHAAASGKYAVCYNLGVYLGQRGRTAEARQAYRQALTENPAFAPALANLNQLNNCNNFGEAWIDIEFDFECEIHHCFPRSGGSSSAFKVLNIATEPSVWCINAKKLRKVASQFDLILTHDKGLLDLPNARLMLFGSSWVSGVPSTKRFEVSFLYSVGLQKEYMSGYALRKEIWEMRKALPEIFRYYSSTRRPPVDADQPWPYPSKDKLFESMFSLVIENTAEENYFTEKLIDALQTYTVPIYCGCPNIGDYFDVDGIITVSSAAEFAEVVRNLSPEDYFRRAESLARNFEKSLEYVDLLARMKAEIEKAYRGRKARTKSGSKTSAKEVYVQI